jgi:hypothetical protein
MTALAILSIIAVGGCGSPAQSLAVAPTTTSSVPTTTTTTSTSLTTSRPATNERGNLVKQLGEQAGLSDPEDVPLYQFSLDKIGDCTGDYPGPLDAGMHRFVAWMTIATTPAFAPNNGDEFTSSDFHMIGPDGTATGDIGPSTTWQCVPRAQQLPTNWQSATKYAVQVELVSPYQHGELILALPGMNGGWEWTI